MPSVLDRVDPDLLAQVAEQARTSHDLVLPPLSFFNSQPCVAHFDLGEPVEDCRRCGIVLRRHQRVAVSWLFLRRVGLLADQCGLGKTCSAAGTLAMAAEAGELDPARGGGRALVVCRPAALRQWRFQMRRMLPDLSTELIEGTRSKRDDLYSNPWDISLIGHQMFLRDAPQIRELGFRHLVIDDVDAVRHADTKTAWQIKQLSMSMDRTMMLSATPLQKKLDELYDLLDSMGLARPLFGSKEDFYRRYVRRERVTRWIKGRGGRRKQVTSMEVVGYRNIDEFKAKIAPFALRRRDTDIDDMSLPTVIPSNVYLDLHPAQRERYKELADGIIRVASSGEITRINASAKMHYAARICESLAALGEEDSAQASVKFDWIVDKLLGDWSGEEEGEPGEKAVVFINYLDGIEAFGQRLDAMGIGNVRIWGKDRDPKAREEVKERFWDDPDCRVLMGTTAIEMSLDLQCARRLVNVDRIPNAGRMTQLAGRVRRGGSKFSRVFVHNLIASDTHEERQILDRDTEAALAGAVWDEEDPLHTPLSPLKLMQLIAPALESARAA